MSLIDWLARPKWRNPRNETRVHLASLSRKYRVNVGEHSYGRPKVRFPESGRTLTIGRFCSIADKVEIFLGGNHRTEWVSTFPFGAFPDFWQEVSGEYAASRGDVTIGSDVWIGSGAIILPGVAVGHGAVIGARAVVTRDVPPYGMVAGNPARLVRYRFGPETIERLLEIAWWGFPDADVARLAPLLQSEQVSEFIAAASLVSRRREKE